jgi:hypothetical protein
MVNDWLKTGRGPVAAPTIDRNQQASDRRMEAGQEGANSRPPGALTAASREAARRL